MRARILACPPSPFPSRARGHAAKSLACCLQQVMVARERVRGSGTLPCQRTLPASTTHSPVPAALPRHTPPCSTHAGPCPVHIEAGTTHTDPCIAHTHPCQTHTSTTHSPVPNTPPRPAGVCKRGHVRDAAAIGVRHTHMCPPRFHGTLKRDQHTPNRAQHTLTRV